MTLDDLTLETDELGIWLVFRDRHGLSRQMGHISWREITKRIQQQLLQEKFLLVLAELDKDLLDA